MERCIEVGGYTRYRTFDGNNFFRTLQGSGIVALLTAGAFSSIEDAQKALCLPHKTFAPRPEAVATYEQLYPLYRTNESSVRRMELESLTAQRVETTCCIAGGGPAGMMLGYLLARAGVSVTVLEKHRDFFRDFRGDTVHPSTLELMYELGLLNELLEIPHQQLTSVGGRFGDFSFQAADFRHLPVHAKFVALMPQWDFLNFLAERAQRFAAFRLLMEHEAAGLVRNAGKITGVQARSPSGAVEIHSDLVIGCDGRHSIMRQAGGLEVLEAGVPIDVLWFRISRSDDDPERLLGNINYGQVLILINRSNYFQAGLIIAKGSFEEIKQRGLAAFQEQIRRIAPFLGDRVEEIRDWDQVNLLTVQINRLRQWHTPGLLCIGDAAHAMSPAGGVGINLAVQDAVATANLLARPLLEKRVTEVLLAQVQRRRDFPTRVTQRLQVTAHKGMARIFENPGPARAPWQLKAAVRMPGVQRALGRLVGLGVRPEHIQSPEAASQLRPRSRV